MFIQTEIRESQTHGEGVFTLEFVPKGKILSIWRNITLHTAEEYNARESDKPFRWNAVRLVGKWYGYQEGGTMPEDCINHSCEPNVLYFMGNLFAIKDIPAGEELFVDYNYYNSPEDRFKRFVDIRTGRQVNGLTARDCMLKACQIMTKLLEDSEDWDGM